MNKICQIFHVLALSALAVFSFTFSARAQTPQLVSSISTAAPGEFGNSFKINYSGSMGTGTLASNLLTLRMTYPSGSTVSSITDNNSDTYTLAASVDSGSWVTALYYLAGAPTGITQITITFSASVADWHGAVQEYSGVAIRSPLDGTCTGSSTTIACGSAITTTGASGDLVVATMIAAGGSYLYDNSNLTAINPGGNFFLDTADTITGDADEEYAQSVAGSITPLFTASGSSQAFNIVGAAFKASPGAGTNPTGMYILHQQHLNIAIESSQTSYFVSSGNLVVVNSDINSGSTTITINNCAPSNTWTARSPGGDLYPQMLYLPASATMSTNLHCTVASSTSGYRSILVVYDIVGAASSPENVDSTGAQGSGSVLTDFPSVTPTVAPGIAFASEGTGIGPGTGVGTGFLWDNTTYTGATDAGQLNNGDGWQHYFYTNTSQINFTWDQSGASSYMYASAIAYTAAGGPSPAPPMDLKATVLSQ